STGTALAPFRRLRSLLEPDPFRTVNRLIEEAFGPLAFPTEEPLSVTGWTPSCDVYETDKEIVIKAELPGVKKEDVKVGIEDGVLSISGERKFEEETKKENYLRVERSYGAFTRSFTLPARVDSTRISAEFKDGLLQVTLPKREEAKPKGIEIKIK
ncbi:MAG TPA: Hsp20/alpha crystallin family protein, partial [Blastocatellia bacterium]|nr:Hsp20/alpha crystallin family protein [Blastocatellia bacterium]